MANAGISSVLSAEYARKAKAGVFVYPDSGPPTDDEVCDEVSDEVDGTTTFVGHFVADFIGRSAV